MNLTACPPREPRGIVLIIIAALVAVLTVGLISISCPLQAQTKTPRPDRVFDKSTHDCPPRGITLDAEVVRVIDGDTIVVASTVEYHVRLLDCWAPESRTKDAAEKERGLKSKARMNELVTGKAVRVHLPGQSDITDMVTFGRVLGRVWLLHSGVPAVRDVSTIMVDENLATTTKKQ
jgi:endonuclease YncB( thermonuclease family)